MLTIVSPPPPRFVRAFYGVARRAVHASLGSHPALSVARLCGVRKATVFMLHRFMNGGERRGRTDIAMLRTLLGTLRRRGIGFMTLRQLSAHLESNTELPGPTAVFTVDDGYEDFAQLAAPIFAGFDCPATAFLVTDFVGERQWNWWDRITEAFLRSPRPDATLAVSGELQLVTLGHPDQRRRHATELIEALKLVPDAERRRVLAAVAGWLDADLPVLAPPEYAALTWDGVRRLERMGMEFAPHSRTHPVLTRLGDSEVHAEISDSWNALKRECRNPVPIFGYPQGTSDSYGPREIAAVRACGLEGAVTFRRRYVDPRTCHADERYTISRFPLPTNLDSAIYLASGLAWERD